MNVVVAALDHHHVANAGAVFEGVINLRFERKHAAPAVTAICGDDQLGISVVDAVRQRRSTKTPKHHRMGRTNAGTRQHSNGGFGNHRHVDGNTVTLADAAFFEDVSKLGHFAVQVLVG